MELPTIESLQRRTEAVLKEIEIWPEWERNVSTLKTVRQVEIMAELTSIRLTAIAIEYRKQG